MKRDKEKWGEKARRTSTNISHGQSKKTASLRIVGRKNDLVGHLPKQANCALDTGNNSLLLMTPKVTY